MLTTYIRVLHCSPVKPGLHPSKHVPLIWKQVSSSTQWPHVLLQSFPKVPLLQSSKIPKMNLQKSFMKWNFFWLYLLLFSQILAHYHKSFNRAYVNEPFATCFYDLCRSRLDLNTKTSVWEAIALNPLRHHRGL